MKSKYVFAGIVTIALVLVSIALLEVVSANDPGGWTKKWDGGGDGTTWGNAGNWEGDVAPGPSDKVYIPAGSGVTISDARSVAWLHSDQPITISSGGSLTLAGDSVIEGALVMDGDLDVTGNLTIGGLFTWSSAKMSGTGTTTANGGISITSDVAKSLWQRTLDNNGTCTYAGSGLGFYLSTFNNQTGATFNLPTDNPILSIVGGTINNYGTINRTTSSGTTTIQVVFNNSGTVSVQSGTLRLTNSGTHTGLFNVAAGATLSFPTGGGNHQLNAGSNVSGAGTVDVSGANVTVGGSYDLTGSTDISAGALIIDSNITTPTPINLSSGYLEGNGNVTMTGLFTWSGGTLRGTGSTTASGGISITTDTAKSLWGRTLNNNGTCNYAGSGFGLYLSTFNNQTGATFNLPTDNPILSIVGGTINNYGTLNRTTSSGTTTIQVVFNNYGTVNIQNGTLNFGNTYTQTAGSIILNGGSVSTSNPLDIQGGSLKGSGNITGNVSIGASGAVDMELGGTTPGTGASNYDQLNISGSATLSGSLNVTLTGGFTPAIGNTFTIMTFGSCTGTFSTTNLAAPGSGRAWGPVAYNSGSIVLSVVAGSNHAPVAVNDAYSTNEDAALSQAALGVLANDTDSDTDPLTATLVGNVSHGTLVLNADGSFTYTPAANYNGSDSFSYKANDGTTDSAVATVTITVNAINDAPAAPAGGAAYSTDENTVLNQSVPGVLGNVTDSDGNTLTAVLVSSVSHGTLILNADGSFTYTPAAGFAGSDSFSCKANDGTADSSVFTVTITVNQLPPSITSLDLLEAAPGETIRVVITGTKLDGATEVDFGPGTTIEGLTVDSSTQITVDVKVASDAQSGLRDVSVTTPQGMATLEDAFTVKKAPSAGGTPVWIWPVIVMAVLAAGAGGFFLFFLLPRRKAKRS